MARGPRRVESRRILSGASSASGSRTSSCLVAAAILAGCSSTQKVSVYFYRLTAPGFTAIRELIKLRR
jgi:uncharacterized lipoprotein YmbA